MSITTKEEVLEKWATDETRKKDREAKAIRKDIATASSYIKDALARYRKAKLKTRSKKAATEDPFAELENYSSRRDIQDDYGWGFITEAQMDRLNELWDLRESGGNEKGEYHDRVTEMLEQAMRAVGDKYQDQLFDYDQERRAREREAETVARENNQRTWERVHTEV